MVSIDLSTAQGGGQAVVALRGEVDVTAAAGVAAALAEVVARHPDIIVDLADLAFIDCCGLRALAGAREQARQAGGDLQLAAAQRPVLRALALSSPAGAFSVYASVAQARERRPG